MVFDVELLWCSRCTNKCFKKFYESPIAAVWSCHKYLSTSVSHEGFFEYWILRPEWDVIWCFLISTFFQVSLDDLSIFVRVNLSCIFSIWLVQCRYCMYRTMSKTSFGKFDIRMHVHRLNLAWMELNGTYIKPQGRLLHSQRSSQVELKIFEGGHFIYQHLGFARDPNPYQSCNSWMLMHSVKRSNACDMAWLRWLHARNI